MRSSAITALFFHGRVGGGDQNRAGTRNPNRPVNVGDIATLKYSCYVTDQPGAFAKSERQKMFSFFLIVGAAFYVSFSVGRICERGASVTDELEEIILTNLVVSTIDAASRSAASIASEYLS